jgi:hypothetical protein
MAIENLLLRNQPERGRGGISMERNHFFVPLGLLVFFLLCLVPDGQAQPQQNGVSPETCFISK